MEAFWLPLLLVPCPDTTESNENNSSIYHLSLNSTLPRAYDGEHKFIFIFFLNHKTQVIFLKKKSLFLEMIISVNILRLWEKSKEKYTTEKGRHGRFLKEKNGQ